jgi:hypothetical protein
MLFPDIAFQGSTMRGKLLALSLGAVCSANASAEDAPQPQPLAAGGAIAAAKARSQPLAAVVASPVVMETSAVLAPDGTLTLKCIQMPNPHPVPLPFRRPAPEAQQ